MRNFLEMQALITYYIIIREYKYTAPFFRRGGSIPYPFAGSNRLTEW